MCSRTNSQLLMGFAMDYSVSSGLIIRPKNFKTPFLQDISNSCHEVIVIGLKPLQKIFDEKISIILRVNPPQSFNIKGGAADVQVVL